MGESVTRAAQGWGLLAGKLLEHELVKFLSQADAGMLSNGSAPLLLYDHLRSFMALKSGLRSSEPESDVLLPAHEAILIFSSRLFMAAHQTLLNGVHAEDGAKPAAPRGKGRQKSINPSKRFLLEWQLVRLKAARERLILELADLSERNEQTFLSLGLPQTVNAEVESARLRVSSVWRELPLVLWESSVPREIGGRVAY